MTAEDARHKAQLEAAFKLMDRYHNVYAALADPESMSEEMKAQVKAARERLKKYHIRTGPEE